MAPAPIAMGTVAAMSTITEPAVAPGERPPADRFMRALLRVDSVAGAQLLAQRADARMRSALHAAQLLPGRPASAHV